MSEYLAHAGTYTIHKARVDVLGNRRVVNRSRTQCGAPTTWMYEIAAVKARRLSAYHCKRCFKTEDRDA